jgi:hypothetical protein
MAGETSQEQRTKLLRKPDGQTMARHGGTFFGHLLGGVISKIVVALVIALVGAYLGLTKIAHVSLTPQNTISTTVVLGKLTKIEQVHVATRSYPVDVTVTQSVSHIPCALICNQMELKGSGTDDAIVDLSTLSKQDVSVDQATGTVTVTMAPPAIGPAVLDLATCKISSSHGFLNGATQDFRSNPNGYQPLYVGAENQIHNAAVHDQDLLSAGEQSTRALLARVLGAAGVKRVTVNFG